MIQILVPLGFGKVEVGRKLGCYVQLGFLPHPVLHGFPLTPLGVVQLQVRLSYHEVFVVEQEVVPGVDQQ